MFHGFRDVLEEQRLSEATIAIEKNFFDASLYEVFVAHIPPGMVLAIGNCGIYRESFGVRAEDTVWVSERGPVSLTRHPKILRA